MSNKLVAKRPRRSIYILPNLFTTAALMCGFAGILLALDANFSRACVLIFVAMILDGCDGRVARWTNTQSDFGAEYDSLADMVSFGLAPALIIYLWALKDLGGVSPVAGRLGWFIAFIYTACAALRLARFNVSIGSIDKRYFMGLPSPSAAALVVGFVFIGDDLGFKGNQLNWVALIITLYAGLMMVTNTLFYSFKSIEISRVKFYVLLCVVAYGGLLLAYPSKTLFATFVTYGFSGPIHWIIRRKRRNQSIIPNL